ncbi:hypothetical protein K469DRAFT_707828 [Zopfia rhizophila CBS 207.26]|uniref:Uncharacterized protein n=1 Tax=Zopfia rhizophila CBS 207.26 TaxID=1314779 RepID=A0A6A6E3L1_9PEZI|nr:hypothetical protein K469DRAFT_707828 [Zopfia rhizophila CBS 207.26]
MGKNKEKRALKKAAKAAAAAEAEATTAQAEVEMTDAGKSGTPTMTPKPSTNKENITSTAMSDGPTLPSLYEAKLNPEGGISLGEAPTGKPAKPTKREQGQGGKQEKQKGEADRKSVHDPAEADAEQTSRAKKRRKNKKNTGNAEEEKEEEALFAPAPPLPFNLLNPGETSRRDNSKPEIFNGLEPLHTPWELIAPNLRRDIEKRVGSEKWWTQNSAPVVLTRNANITSSINKLKAYLGHSLNPFSTIPMPSTLTSKSLLIPVSAQCEATSKLVSIIELTKRIVTPGETRQGTVRVDEGEEERKEVETWYLYTSLSGRTVEKKVKRKWDDVREYASDFKEGKTYSRKSKAKKFARAKKRMEQGIKPGKKDGLGDVDMGEVEPEEVPLPESGDEKEEEGEEEVFETLDREEKEDPPTKTVPVLTIWLSKTPIPEFRDAFGEQTFKVVKTQQTQSPRQVKMPVSVSKQVGVKDGKKRKTEKDKAGKRRREMKLGGQTDDADDGATANAGMKDAEGDKEMKGVGEEEVLDFDALEGGKEPVAMET